MAVVARKKSVFTARGVLVAALSLLTVVLLGYLYWRRSKGLGFDARSGFVVFAYVQLVAAGWAAPALGVNAASEIRSQSALDLLRLAAIDRSGVVLSKLIGVCVWPMLIVASQIPFLAVWTLWGGISGQEVVMLVTCTAAFVASLVSVSLAMGFALRASDSAYSLTYIVAAAFAILLPFGLYEYDPTLTIALHPVNTIVSTLRTGHVPLTWKVSLFTSALVVLLSALFAMATLAWQERTASVRRSRRDTPSRPVWTTPVLWRELHSSTYNRIVLVLAWLGSGVTTVLALETTGTFASAARFTAYWILPALLAGTLGATAISEEVKARTVVPILLAPNGPRQVVVGKLMGAIARAAPMFIGPAWLTATEPTLVHGLELAGCVAVTVLVTTNGMAMSVFTHRTPFVLLLAFYAAGTQAYLVAFLFMGAAAALADVGIDPQKPLGLAILLTVALLGMSLVMLGNMGIASSMFEPTRLERSMELSRR